MTRDTAVASAPRSLVNLLTREDGSNLVEFALSLTLLLSLVLGIVGMAQLAYAMHFVTFAARQGTRYAVVHGATFAGTPCGISTTYACQAAAADVSSFVKSQIPLGLASQNTSVLTSWPGLAGSGLSCLALAGANSPGCLVQVTVRYNFSFGLPFLPSGTWTLQSASQASILQ